MTIRTTKRHVTFAQPWFLDDDQKEVFPQGAYEVETDEELIEGLSFAAYRRLVSVVRLPQSFGSAGISQALATRPDQLDAALARDNRSSRSQP